MKKRIWTLVILVVVAVFGGRAWYLHKQATAEKDVVKTGALLPSAFLLNTTSQNEKR